MISTTSPTTREKRDLKTIYVPSALSPQGGIWHYQSSMEKTQKIQSNSFTKDVSRRGRSEM
jgi:hypothetical protein